MSSSVWRARSIDRPTQRGGKQSGARDGVERIAAAVIGGTSFSGGIGTIPGAVLGALIMQSLVSGMVLMGIEAPLQDIAVGWSSSPQWPSTRSSDDGRGVAEVATAEAVARTPLVELRDIRVAFGGVHAVDGVTVDLYPGEVVGLVGATAPASRRS